MQGLGLTTTELMLMRAMETTYVGKKRQIRASNQNDDTYGLELTFSP